MALLKFKNPLTVRTAGLLLAAYYFFVLAFTICALAGVWSAQVLCHDDSMAEYWTPEYTAFRTQMNVVSPYTCKWFQLSSWWALAWQLVFVLCFTANWLLGTLERHMSAMYCMGALSSALNVVTCLIQASEHAYYVHSNIAWTRLMVGYYGFALCSMLNCIMVVVATEYFHLKRKAQSRTARNTLPGLRSSGSEDSEGRLSAMDKASQSPMPDSV